MGTSAGNADIGGRSGYNNDGPGVASGDSSSPFGAPLVARLDFYRRIRQGLATAEELLPAGMLSAAPLGKASSPPTPLRATVTSLTSDGLACPTGEFTFLGASLQVNSLLLELRRGRERWSSRQGAAVVGTTVVGKVTAAAASCCREIVAYCLTLL